MLNKLRAPGDRAPSTRFPGIGWAWPKGDLDQLLYSAVFPDYGIAKSRFEEWLGRNDIDEVGFREHRLLAAISHRFGKDLARHPEYPRLIGLQRMLWTKSRMAIGEALPVLRAMVDGGLEVMLFKGAGRIALDAESQKGRVAHDIDILLHTTQIPPALDVLWDGGWLSASGESRLRIQLRAQSARATSFFKGHFGDIDLHQRAFHDQNANQEADQTLWSGKIGADFFGLPVFVPSPEERIALAVGHGGLDANTHGDWLVDCASTIRREAVDWNRFLQIVRARQLALQAQIALSYLKWRLGSEVPADVLNALSRTDGQLSVRDCRALLLAKPTTDWGIASRIARAADKPNRLKTRRMDRSENMGSSWKGRIRRTGKSSGDSICQVRHALDFATVSKNTSFRCELQVFTELPASRRRIEFEINSQTRHVAHLRARTISNKAGAASITFTGEMTLLPEDKQLWIESRPSKQLREGEPAQEYEKFGALSFRVAKFALT